MPEPRHADRKLHARDPWRDLHDFFPGVFLFLTASHRGSLSTRVQKSQGGAPDSPKLHLRHEVELQQRFDVLQGDRADHALPGADHDAEPGVL